jgi:hypothetical protein
MDHSAKLYHSAKQRARRFSIVFDIAQGDIAVPTACPVLGIPIRDYTGTGRSRGNCNFDAASLDRFDNSKGYVKDNVHVISMRANTLKNDGTVAEFAHILLYMLQHSKELSADDLESLEKLQDRLNARSQVSVKTY